MTAHLRKSATSVPSNIAEGCGRNTEKELARFFSIAAGSASEFEYQLLLAHDLEYLPRDAYAGLNDRASDKVLGRLQPSAISAQGIRRFAPLTADSPAPPTSFLVPATPG